MVQECPSKLRTWGSMYTIIALCLVLALGSWSGVDAYIASIAILIMSGTRDEEKDSNKD